LGFTVEEFITLQEVDGLPKGGVWDIVPELWENAKAYMRDEESGIFHVVFKTLHASAQNGNDVDSQMLINIVRGIDWLRVPGGACLVLSAQMVK
jgi:hypothetical protein